jgi:hypothetical protein
VLKKPSDHNLVIPQYAAADYADTLDDIWGGSEEGAKRQSYHLLYPHSLMVNSVP